MEGKLRLYKCSKGHYSVSPRCTLCFQPAVIDVEYREGDCIACGQLCPGYAYACNSPSPLTSFELKELKRNNNEQNI